MDKIIVKNKKVYFVKIKNFMRTTPKSIFIEKTTVFILIRNYVDVASFF